MNFHGRPFIGGWNCFLLAKLTGILCTSSLGTWRNPSQRKGTFAILTCVYCMWAPNNAVLQFYTSRVVSGSCLKDMALSWGAFRPEHTSSLTIVMCKQKWTACVATTWHKDALRSVGRPFAVASSSRLSSSEQLRAVFGESNSFNFTRVIPEGQQLLLMSAAQSSVVIVYSDCISIQKLCPLLLSAFMCFMNRTVKSDCFPLRH
jgi:hypothetical protein